MTDCNFIYFLLFFLVEIYSVLLVSYFYSMDYHHAITCDFLLCQFEMLIYVAGSVPLSNMHMFIDSCFMLF